VGDFQDCQGIRLSIASPEQIHSWSYGEVKKPFTLNYRSLKPEKDGLLCERIFGPVKDWMCACGKYRGHQKKGIVCDQCGVEVGRSDVRRERFGHIDLAVPVGHIWYVKGAPSYLALLLALSPRQLVSVVYFASYIVTFVDEEARQQALERLADELGGLPALEKRAGGARKRGGNGPGGARFSAGRREIEERRERELAAARAAESETLRQLRGCMDREAEIAIVFGPTGQVVVEPGQVVEPRHLEVLEQMGESWREAIAEQARDSLELLAETRPVSGPQPEDGTGRAHAAQGAAARRVELEQLQQSLEGLRVMSLLSEQQYWKVREAFGDIFSAGMGAQAVRDLLAGLDLDALACDLRAHVSATVGPVHTRAARRLRVVEAFRASGVRPEWMILTVLPVLPPDLRPVVQLDGNRLASADLNDLYRRVISRNQRVKVLMDVEAPEIILRNEKRMLQEAVDTLFDNGRRGKTATGKAAWGGHALKSLAAMLRGKQGRFRENLLGKRVDYSGRSVIVVGPDLKLHQCGLPKAMALELFKPFVMQRLVQERYAANIKSAKRFVEEWRPEVWDVLEEVIKNHPVILNRPPTLHRLNIMAFQPVLVEGSALQLHPLVCSAFNADFDGDTMAVHVPLSPAAQEEAMQLLLSTRNVLSPATGEPTFGATQDMVLGCYYLTQERPGAPGEGRVFSDATEALLAFESRLVALQARVRVRIPDAGVFDEPPPAGAGTRPKGKPVTTTVGRLIFNEVLPEDLRFKNYTMKKEHLRQLLGECVKRYGMERAAELADAIKRLGFRHATRVGATIAISDVQVPAGKREVLAQADASIAELEDDYRDGLVTEQERYQQTVDIWNGAAEAVARMVEQTLDPFGSIATISVSGATKAKLQQIRQLSGMRGLMASPSGKIIAIPIRGNFREGLSVLEYFISSHGARKGLADTALRTAEAGHLTRRLVDVAQDVIITEPDCGTTEGVLITDEGSRALGLDGMRSRLLGRVLAEAAQGATDLGAGVELSDEAVDRLLAAGVKAVRVRSTLTCQARRGLCCRCYGRDLSSGQLVSVGTAVGIIAAQSIGEPGTQLTLRTFHTGGIAGAQGDITQGLPRVEELFEARIPKEKATLSELAGVVDVVPAGRAGGGCTIRVVSTAQGLDEYPLQSGSQLLVKDGERVEVNQALALPPASQGSEPAPVLARVQGEIGFTSAGVLAIRYEEREERAFPVPATHSLVVQSGQVIQVGTPLTRGSPDPQDILRIAGREAAQLYLVQEVQRVYRNTGVYLDDKHAEVVVRQMLRRVQIDHAGDTHFLPGELVDRLTCAQVNAAVLAQGGEPATARTILLGITKASLAAESWLAAASFQDTTRVLTRAAVEAQLDQLVGLKENLILGKLIPAGTGLAARRPRRAARARGVAPLLEQPEAETRIERGEAVYV